MLKDCIKRNSENAISSYSSYTILKYCTYNSYRLAATTMKMELVYGYIVVDLLRSDVFWMSLSGIGPVVSDVLWMSWIIWYCGLCSPMCCSGMSCLW